MYSALLAHAGSASLSFSQFIVNLDKSKPYHNTKLPVIWELEVAKQPTASPLCSRQEPDMSYHITICTAHKKALVQIYYWKGDPMQKQKLHSVGIEYVMLTKPSYHSLICLHSIYLTHTVWTVYQYRFSLSSTAFSCQLVKKFLFPGLMQEIGCPLHPLVCVLCCVNPFICILCLECNHHIQRACQRLCMV